MLEYCTLGGMTPTNEGDIFRGHRISSGFESTSIVAAIILVIPNPKQLI